MKVVFTATVVTKEARPQRFEEGKVYDLPPRSARHWINRSKARLLESGEEARTAEPVPVQSLSPAEREQVDRLAAPKASRPDARSAAVEARQAEEHAKARVAEESARPTAPVPEAPTIPEPADSRQLRDDGTVKGAGRPDAAATADINPEPKAAPRAGKRG